MQIWPEMHHVTSWQHAFNQNPLQFTHVQHECSYHRKSCVVFTYVKFIYCCAGNFNNSLMNNSAFLATTITIKLCGILERRTIRKSRSHYGGKLENSDFSRFFIGCLNISKSVSDLQQSRLGEAVTIVASHSCSGLREVKFIKKGSI